MLRHVRLYALVALLLLGVTAAVAAAPFAYVTNSGNNSVLVVDTATNSGLTPIALPAGTVPYGVAISPDGSRVYVANFVFSGGSLIAIDTATNSVVKNQPVGILPFGVAAHPSGGKVYVTLAFGNKMAVVDVATWTVTLVGVGSPRGVAVNPAGTRIYVANNLNTVSVFDAATNTLITAVEVGLSPIGVAVSPDGNRVYVTNEDSNSVSVIDALTNTLVDTVIVGSHPIGVAVTPDGSRVYVANSVGNSVSVIDAATNTAATGDVSVGRFPYGISTDGSHVYVAVRDDNKVAVIDRATNVVVANIAAAMPIGFGQFVRSQPKVATKMILGLAPESVVLGSAGPVNATATLQRKDTGLGVSGATVTFSVDGVTRGSVATSSNGVATWSFNPSALGPGSHTVKAAFGESAIGGMTFEAANASASLRVLYQWVGWMPPVAGGGVLNPANAGSTIPVKWQMKDASGNAITSLSAIVEVEMAVVPCAGEGMNELAAPVSTGGTGLHYDGTSQQFQFNWKTDRSWSGQCRAFIVRLADGTTRMAKFQFR